MKATLTGERTVTEMVLIEKVTPAKVTLELSFEDATKLTELCGHNCMHQIPEVIAGKDNKPEQRNVQEFITELFYALNGAGVHRSWHAFTIR